MPISLDVDVDFSGMEASLLAAEEHVIEALSDALRAAGTLVAAEAMQTTSFRDRDARLRPSIRRGEVHYDDAGALGIDVIAGSSEVHYAGYIEFGTRTITPRRFMRDALAKHEQTISKLIADAYAKAFETAARGNA